MKRKRRLLILVAAAIAIVAGGWAMWRHERPTAEDAAALPRPPRIRPDYSAIVIPPNIAPLNFVVGERGRRFLVRIRAEAGDAMEILSHSPKITIPPRRWRSLLDANRGKELRVEVCAEVDGQWHRYQSIVNRIAKEDIDRYVVYRLVGPIHNKWNEVGVYQRDLATYRESVVLDGMSLGKACVNCHSFANNRPDPMFIGMRSHRFGTASVLVDHGEVTKIGTRFGYTAWHPSSRVAAYSINRPCQLFHAAGAEVREVVDLDAALAYYVVGSREARMVPRASDKERLETYPAWSPDGRHLYYSSAAILWKDRNAMPPARYDEVKYDLMRISYDIDTDTWGAPETVLSAEETGLSILMPRISPDGRFLLFCMCRYGCFPVYQPTSDLYMMDLATTQYTKLPINSDFSESWHCWSSNGRWIAFSTRRRGGTFTRCYVSFVDATGKAHKPFIVPQRDPEFYDSFLKTVSVPELITGPVPIDGKTLARGARSESVVVVDAVTRPTQPAAFEPWQQAEPYRPAPAR